MPTKLNSLSQLRGVSDKRACIVATVGNISFTGITQIDGVTLSNNDRVLVWVQSNAAENGIYVLSESTNLVRAVDSKVVSDFIQGTQYFVISGNTYAEKLFYLKNKITTLGVDNIELEIFAGLSGTSGTSGSSGTSGGTGSSGASGSSGTSGTGFQTITNSLDNRILTSLGTTDTANAEANLTFDGSILNVNTTSALRIPAGTTGERPVSPTVGMVRWNTTRSTFEIYAGLAWASVSLTSDPIYPTSLTYFVVAGGGGGGGSGGRGGGGGAGGILTGTTIFSANTNYTITIGGGGAGATSATRGSTGSNTTITGTTFSGVTTNGGGGGGGGQSGAIVGPSTGGSGGGGGGYYYSAGAAGISGQGFAGGNGTTPGNYGGGGGGGKTQVGTAGSGNTGGKGGNGITTDFSGATASYGGGGGGGGYSGPRGEGGLGGGGAGAGTSTESVPGTPNTGGGGGGSQSAGGSGLVMIKYTGFGAFSGGTIYSLPNSVTLHVFTATGQLTYVPTT